MVEVRATAVADVVVYIGGTIAASTEVAVTDAAAATLAAAVTTVRTLAIVATTTSQHVVPGMTTTIPGVIKIKVASLLKASSLTTKRTGITLLNADDLPCRIRK
jgi:hypothetical protein